MSSGMSEARIQIHLDVHNPIELMDLTLSFQALAFQYRKHLVDHVRSSGAKPSDEDVKLYITNIESNCILAELGSAVNILGSLFSVMDYVNIFVDFVKNLDKSISYFRAIGESGEVDPKNVGYSKAECGRVADLLDIAAKNTDGNLNISVLEYDEKHTKATSKVTLKVSYSSDEAYQAKKGALLAQKALEYKGEADYKSVLMYFYQTNIDDPKSGGQTGDKAVIKTISDNPLSVYFVSELDQQKIAYTLSDPENNPFKLSYIVDVNVETDRNDKPRAYRILNVSDTIEDDDES